MTHAPLRIGVSACTLAPDPHRSLFKGKTLLYVEQSMLAWLMQRAVVPVMIPPPAGAIDLGALLALVDGVVLHGGSDVSPRSYGAEPLRPEWEGDRPRDRYETQIVAHCLEQRLPVLGVCRGVQVLNVALGGSLYQDIGTELPGAIAHRDQELYDRLFHDVEIVEGSRLASVLGLRQARVNSVHHQAIRELGDGLVIEARSTADGVIEAVRLAGDTYAAGVQWHPEFQDGGDGSLPDPLRLLDDFLEAVRHRT